MTQRATIYARFSPRPSKEGDDERLAAQEDAESIRCQLEECTRYCERKGLTVVSVLKDPETSARKTKLFDREQGFLLQQLPRGHHVVCLDIDRAFRDTIDGLTTLDYFCQHGIAIHFANQGGNSIDASTPDGRLFLTIRLGFAEYEPRKIAERTSRGMKHRMADGEMMTHPNCIPYGFELNDDGRVVPSDQEQEAMRLAVSMRKRNEKISRIGQEIAPLMARWDRKAPDNRVVSKFLTRAREAVGNT